MDDSTIHAVADAHGRSVRDGDSERARSDVAPEFREGAGAIARALPNPVTSYEVVTASVRDDAVGVVQLRYSGPDSSVVVESAWSVRDGRPVMVGAHIVERSEEVGRR